MTERLGQDLPIVALLVATALAGFLIFDVFARFTYTLSDRALIMRVHVLRIVPWSRRTIPFSHIQEAHGGYHPRWFVGSDGVWGHFFKKGVITIILNHRVGLVKRYFITPDAPARFLAELRRRVPASTAR